MSLKGDLSTVGLAEVFQMISMSQKQGTLVVHDGESRKAIYFGKEGVSLLSTGKRKGFRIGDILVRYAKITSSQLEEVLQKQRESRRMVGEELVASGLVTDADIQEVVRSQIEEEIYDLFLWKRAAFEFIEGDPVEELMDPESKAIRLAFDLNGLLLEAVRRTDEWTRINQKIPSLDFIYTFVSGEAEKQEGGTATERVKVVVANIDGQATVAEIVEHSLMPRFDICNILVDLMDRGRIRQLDVTEIVTVAKRRLEEGKRERGLALFQVAVLHAPEDVELLDSYAHALETEGLMQDAARTYLRVGNLLKAKDQVKDSVGYFQRALSLLPNDPQSKEALFEINLASGNIEEALQAAQEIVAAGLRARDFVAARSVAEKAVAAAPQNLEVRLGLARIYHALNMKSERDEMVRFIQKNLPVDQAAADRIQVELREISESQAPRTVKLSSHTPVRKSRGAGRMVATIVVVIIVLTGGGVFYEMKARSVYKKILGDARLLETAAELTRARDMLQTFQATPWRFSPTTKSKYQADLAALETRLKEAVVVTPTPTAVAVEDPEKIAARLREEELKRLKVRAVELEDAMMAEKQRGEMVKAKDLALELLAIADQIQDTRIKKHAEEIKGQMEKYLAEAYSLQVEINEHLKSGSYAKAADAVENLIRMYPYSDVARAVAYPLALRVRPEGVGIFRDKRKIGESGAEDVILRVARDENAFALTFSKPGYKSRQEMVKTIKQGLIQVTLDEKEPEWIFPVGTDLESAPVPDGDQFYIRTREMVIALSTDKRIRLWSEKVEGTGSVKLVGGRLYVPSGNTLLVFDPRKPEGSVVVDKIDVGNSILGTPGFSADGKTVYVGTVDKFLVAFHLESRETWKREFPREVRGEPIERDGGLIVPCMDNTLYAVKGPEITLWKAPTGGALGSAPLLADDTLYIGSADGKVYAIGAADGTVRWTSENLGGAIESTPLLVGKTILAPTLNRILYAMDASTGALKWKCSTEGALKSTPLLASGLLLFGSGDSRLYAADPETGDILWRCTTGKRIRFTPAISEKLVIFVSDDQNLYAVKLD